MSLVLLCVIAFLFACVPTALGCTIDIKPGSYPNSINVNNNGVVTVAVYCDEEYVPDSVTVYLEGADVGSSGPSATIIPVRYERVSGFNLGPYDTGYYLGPYDVYIVKLDTQELRQKLNLDNYLYKNNVWLGIRFDGVEKSERVRLISNNK